MKSKILFKALLNALKTNHPDCVSVDLSRQALEDEDVIALTEALKGNTQVHSLDLSGNPTLTEKSLLPLMNRLATLTLSTLKLNDLALTESSLVALGNALRTYNTLQVLDLSGIPLSERSLKTLGQGLSSHAGFKALYLQKCALNAAAEAFTSLLFNCPKSLQILKLTHNHLNSTVAAWLQPPLALFKELRELDVSYNLELGSRGAEAIAQVIKNLAYLTVLKLDEVALEGGVELFFTALGKHLNLKSLSLAHNQLEKGDALALQTWLPQYALTALNLEGNPLIEGDGSFSFSEALTRVSSLQHLKLGDTGCIINLASLMPHLKNIRLLGALDISHKKLGYALDSNQLGALLQALPHLPHLRWLNLSDNQLGEEAGVALGQALCNQAGLENLNLSGNPLGEKGNRAFLGDIKRHPTLQRLSLAKTQLTQLPEAECLFSLKSLDVSNNALNQKSIVPLCNVLKITKTLQQLNISHNSFGTEGLKVFIQEGLGANTTLLSLDLKYTGLGEEAAILLKAVFTKHPTLQRIVFEGNALSPSLVDELEALNAEKQYPYKAFYQAIAQGFINPALLTTLSPQHLRFEEDISGNLLHHAARRGEKAVFQTLVELYQQHRLPLNERNGSGQTPEDIAIESGYPTLATKLETLALHYGNPFSIQTSTSITSALLYLHDKAKNDLGNVNNYLPKTEETDYLKKPKESYYYMDVAHYDSQAIQWFNGAKEGNSIAQFNIACCYYEGTHGVTQNYKAAVFWYENAAKQGDVEAANTLGNCCKKGNRGVPQDVQKAIEWFTLAAEKGHAPAQFNLGACHQAMAAACKEPQQTSEYQKAVHWYREATNQNHKEAPYYLGLCYEKGWGVSANSQTALECYIKAKNRGCELAQPRIEKLTSTESKVLNMKRH